MNFTEICRFLHYPSEEYDIVTKDGYILKMFRLQAKNQATIDNDKPIILIQHGLLDVSDSFIVNEEQNAPALVLANQGYDIWLGNSRGNVHSRRHLTLDPDYDREFWNFTFQEMIDYDLPVFFEFILNKTQGRHKINYFGHSQGSLQMFAHLSQRTPLIVNNVGKVVAFAPAVYFQHIEAFNQFYIVANLFHYFEFEHHLDDELMPSCWVHRVIAKRMCGWFQFLCRYLVGFFTTKNYDLDADRYDILSDRSPSGSSVKNAMHYKQLIQSGIFRKYDYGPEGNMIEYGQTTPPSWDLSKITEDIALVVGNYDPITTIQDVQRLRSELTGVKNLLWYQFDSGHLTYMFGKQVPHIEAVINFLKDNETEHQNKTIIVHNFYDDQNKQIYSQTYVYIMYLMSIGAFLLLFVMHFKLFRFIYRA